MTFERSASPEPRESRILQVAPAAAWVMQNADHVHIHGGKIAEYCRYIFSKYPLITHLDANHLVTGDREETAAYILALDSINFGSGYFDGTIEYNMIAQGLKRAFEAKELNRPEQWAVVTPADFSRLLSVPENELLGLFAQHLRFSGEQVIRQYGGRVLALLEEARYSAPKLAEIVAGWSSFRDVSQYKGREVPFFKRAQILAADTHLALRDLTDIDALTMFADNMVPHVLRCDGILEYSDDLAAKIERGDFIEAGSAEEVEIRAAAIHAVELIKYEAWHLWPGIRSVQIDHILWNRGYEPEIYAKPRHRTLTTAY